MRFSGFDLGRRLNKNLCWAVNAAFFYAVFFFYALDSYLRHFGFKLWFLGIGSPEHWKSK